jgi:hypothetical protein
VRDGRKPSGARSPDQRAAERSGFEVCDQVRLSEQDEAGKAEHGASGHGVQVVPEHVFPPAVHVEVALPAVQLDH